MDKKIVSEFGWVSSDSGIVDLNWSSTKSALIRACGQFTEEYNSDLLIDLETVEKLLSIPVKDWEKSINPTDVSPSGFREVKVSPRVVYYSHDNLVKHHASIWFGFRKCGVDHLAYLMSNKEQGISAEHAYRAIYQITINIGFESNRVSLELWRTDEYPDDDVVTYKA